MSLKTALVVVVCLFAATQIQAEYIQYNFTNDIDGLVSHRGKWEWSDRASLPWRLPEGGDGFAVHYKVGEGDELYEPVVDISNGLEYEIKYFIASEYDRSTTLQIQQLSLQGQLIEIVADYYVNSYPYNEEWFIATGKLEASNIPSRFGVFCQTNGENTVGDYLYGCALDYMKINAYDPPTTTTKPTTTTPTSTTTTTTPTTTTTTTTTTPTTTTTTPTTTTTTPTTTTTTPTTTTTTPTTTTTTPTTTTTTPTTTTTTPTTTSTTPTTTTTTPTTTTTTPTTTTTTPTTTTTTTPTTTTPTTTTTTPTTTTTTPTTTTTTPTTTTTTPTTTTTTPTTTTTTPTTTTTTPTTTTTIPITTEAPDYSIEFDFSNDTSGWTLGRSNGASWRRAKTDFGSVKPMNGDHALQVYPEDSYSGTVLAMSPRLIVGPYGTVNVTVEFFMSATSSYPAYMKVRRSLSYEEYDEKTILNLDVFGNQLNFNWLTASGSFSNLVPGEEFNVVLEGNLGIANKQNAIAVSRVFVDGVESSYHFEDDFFDFGNGLVGWQSGSMDGGIWKIVEYSESEASLGIPEPSTGNILIVDRFNIHSGVISIESPPINCNSMGKNINLKFWIRGTEEFPVSFRLSWKTIDGVYQEFPFLNLNDYGLYNSDDWINISTSHEIPINQLEQNIQIILEADLGGGADNLLVVESIDFEPTS